MQIQRALEQLGYPHNEIKVYLALLQLGEGTVSDMSRAADLPRSTTQLVVEELQKKGLLSHCVKPQGSVWLAESPSRFLTNLHEKEMLLHKLLPELQAIKHESKLKPLFRYFTGLTNVQHIFEEVLNSKYPVQIMGSVLHMSQCLDDTIRGTQHRIRVYEDERLHRVVYILFNNHVALILLSPKESIGIIFEDSGLAECSTLFFRRLWDDAEP